jgi:REP element-mobilizing transposase RayT
LLATARSGYFGPQQAGSYKGLGIPLIDGSQVRAQACAMDSRASGHKALRKGRMSLAQHAYSTTTVTRSRQRLFDDFAVACAACRVLGSQGAWRDARPLAWVLMPDHLHCLVQLGDRPLSSVMQAVHSLTARAVNVERGVSGPVWQGAFHDRALRADDDLLEAARYLVANPVRAGLVERVGSYPFWGATWVANSPDPGELLL